jgi:Protein of unknown function (DUF2934)
VLKPRFDPFRFTRPIAPTQAERHRMIADLAFRRSEQRGFVPGSELEDWLAAEREIDFELSARYLSNDGWIHRTNS